MLITLYSHLVVYTPYSYQHPRIPPLAALGSSPRAPTLYSVFVTVLALSCLKSAGVQSQRAEELDFIQIISSGLDQNRRISRIVAVL